MSSAIIQLLVLAGIAVFLILRLRSVLGTREGFEKPPVSMPDPAARRNSDRHGFEVIEGGVDTDITDHVPDGSEAAKALAAMKLAEPGFAVGEFLHGARGAYEMILMAFEKGTLDEVNPFLAPDIRDSFAEVVKLREDQGLTVDASFVGVREVVLKDATYDRETGEAELTVKFVGELISVVRNKAGDVIEGNPDQIRRQRDVWTFARRMGVDDPNWQLVATGE
ncbi:Tim44/TimA family putative adaptor protein [Rhodovulum adriaticum]|uniref:Putative lipid-binding transport protein (Tim44 family) n=1 Tax=Rhodovulum adriaticum TaxID=35804 RepID=A0A4R2P0W0_RHOAD|nr:Tim44/TimA family putative adaptor protein [Rhodovulum adriaticum]MBK1634876.1 preprotein translocase subunit Tim44 [Rhodovulum adriaticum]TCP27544.1 putative lipid-binding transport protein (Tim44 family) [Rhodovulum adriaticum]